MEDTGHVLLADIGGTNARFALADTAAPTPLVAGSAREYVVADFASLRTATAAGYRDSAIVARSQHEARNIRSRSESLAREGAQGVNLVRDRMDDACASFIQQGLVRLETNTPAS